MIRVYILMIAVASLLQGCSLTPSSTDYKFFSQFNEEARKQGHVMKIPPREAWQPKHPELTIKMNVEAFLSDQVIEAPELNKNAYRDIVRGAAYEMMPYYNARGGEYSLIAEVFDSGAKPYYLIQEDRHNISPYKQLNSSTCKLNEGCFCSYSYSLGVHLVLMKGTEVITSSIVDGTNWRMAKIDRETQPTIKGVCETDEMKAKEGQAKVLKKAKRMAIEDLKENIPLHLGFFHDYVGDNF